MRFDRGIEEDSALRPGQPREDVSHFAAAGIETEPLPSPVQVHSDAYTEISISPIDRDFTALHADDFPANSPSVHASDNGDVNESAVPTNFNQAARRTRPRPAQRQARSTCLIQEYEKQSFRD